MYRFLIIAALCLVSGIGNASLLDNGGFESGNLSGWYSSSTTAIIDESTAYTPISGNYSALIVALSTAPVPPYSCNTDIWNVNCPQSIPFTPSTEPSPTYQNFREVDVSYAFLRGGFIGRDIVVSSGDIIEWVSQALGEAGGIDQQRFYATNGTLEEWLDFNSTISAFQFSVGGLWSIYFGLYQTEDSYIYSALMLDSVSILEIPEPNPAPLVLLGLIAITLVRRSIWKSNLHLRYLRQYPSNQN